MKIGAITIFEFKKVLFSGRWSFPLILLVAYLAMTYSMAPAGVLNTFAVSSYVFFLLMLSFALLVNSMDAEMVDQSILSKCREHLQIFYMARVLSISLYTFLGTVIAMTFPLIRYAISGTGFFLRPFTVSDIVVGLVLHYILGMIGAVFGLILNGRVIKKRQIAVGIAVLFAIICIVKDALIIDFPIMQYILWILPPISNIVKRVGEASIFQMSLIPLIIWGIMYFIIEWICYVICMKKIRFK